MTFSTLKLMVIVLMISIFSACKRDKLQVDTIVFNGKIFTLDQNFAIAEAMAIDDGIIMATGTTAEILSKYDSKEKIDLKNTSVYPGFYDAHCHFYGYALDREMFCDLTSCKSMKEVVSTLQKFRALNPTKPIILGRGWDQNVWSNKSMPNNLLLNQTFDSVPVLLIRVDGHAVLANQAALDKAKFTKESQIENGKIVVEKNLMTGILLENAADSILKLAAFHEKKSIYKALISAQNECFKVGLTSLVEAGLETHQIEIIRSLQKMDALKIKIYAMLLATSPDLNSYLKNGPIRDNRFHLQAVKFYSDGALGSRGACLLEPYSDDASCGMLLIDSSDFKNKCKSILESGFQVAVHAIGDSANRVVLNVFAQLLIGKNDLRWRIEHAQVVSPSDLHFFADYSIIPSVNAIHAIDDGKWAINRLGENRFSYAYNYRNLMAQNNWLANGSDFPVASINPLDGFFALLNPSKTAPKNSQSNSKSISRKDALFAMTLWAAKSCFEENERGSLEIGKAADFVVLSANIMDEKITNTNQVSVLATFIDGIIVYSKNFIE